MSTIYFRDHRRIGFEILEKEYVFGDFRVIEEEDREGFTIYRKVTFILKAKCEDSEIEQCFRNIIANKYSYEECGGKCCKSDIDGSITPNREFFPEAFQEFCTKEEIILEQTITRFFDNALWIYKSGALFLQDRMRHWIQFSFDQKEWYLVPILPLKGILGRPYGNEEYQRLENQVKEKNSYLAQWLVKSMENGQTAPIYPRIYFEAIDILNENIQTAIVLAVEAVEVAVKTCIVHFDNKVKWLIENVQSPPLEKIIKEYLTLLIPKEYPAIPKELVNHSLHDAIIARNKIVHSGLYKIDEDKANKLVEDLGRIIAYLECYMGYNWATYFLDRPFNHWFFR